MLNTLNKQFAWFHLINILPAFTCASTIGSLWSICFGVNILRPVLLVGMLSGSFGFGGDDDVYGISACFLNFTLYFNFSWMVSTGGGDDGWDAWLKIEVIISLHYFIFCIITKIIVVWFIVWNNNLTTRNSIHYPFSSF